LSLFLCPFGEDKALTAQEDNSLKERVFTEVPTKMKEYRSFAERLQGSIMISNESKPGGPGKPARWEFKQNERCALVSIKDAVQNPRPGQPTREVYAVNPYYGFQLKGSEANNEWVVTAIESENKDNIQWVDMPVREMVSRSFMLPFAVYGRQLDSLLAEPDFKVSRVAWVNREGRDLVRLDFELPPHPKEKRFYPIVSGSVFLDPGLYWCMRECQLRGRWSSWATIRTLNDFKEIRGYPVLTRSVQTNKPDPNEGPNRPPEVKETKECDFEEPTQLPADQEFMLSAFGLPEPFGVKKAKPRWYLWAAGIGISCLIGGAAFRRYARRSA
jgi:hypothetical protein